MSFDMKLEFSIEGEKQMSRKLTGISRDLKDWNVEFRSTGRLLLKTFKDNFSTQGREIGEQWARLKPSTVRSKVSAGFAGAGTLTRTGRMKRSFKSMPSKMDVVITNPTSYFGYHQSNKPRKKLPRRIMMKIDEKRRQQITKIFQAGAINKLQGNA